MFIASGPWRARPRGGTLARVTQSSAALRPSRRLVLASAAGAAGLAGLSPAGPASAAAHPHPRRRGHGWPTPFVVGHRGASAYRPEHTVASWELAARIGADVIEPDLVSTRDGVLVCRHENEISGTTDVARRPEFADRRTTKVVDGVELTGWFTEDLTLAELKTLRAVERLPALRQRNTIYDGWWDVPTFEEALDARERLSAELGRTVGIVPEIKHSTYFQGLGLAMEAKVVAALAARGLNSPHAPATVQSFELTNLVQLRTTFGLRASSVFLTSATGAPFDLAVSGDPRQYADLLIPSSLRDLARHVDQIGPALDQVVPRRADGTLGDPSSLVEDAHAAGLAVVPYTLRPENDFLPVDYRTGDDPAAYGRVLDLAVEYFATGIDGLFTDAPDIGVLARAAYTAGR